MHGNKPYRVVSVFDEALDLDAMGARERGTIVLSEYLKERPQDALPPARSGMKLAIYHLRRLTEDEMDFCESAPTERRRAIRAFSLGCTLVENAKGADGKVHAALSPSSEVTFSGKPVKVWDDAQLALIDRAVKIEIGGVVYHRSFLASASAPRFLLPRFLLDEYEAALEQHAAVLVSAATATSTEPPPESSAATKADAG